MVLKSEPELPAGGFVGEWFTGITVFDELELASVKVGAITFVLIACFWISLMSAFDFKNSSLIATASALALSVRPASIPKVLWTQGNARQTRVSAWFWNGYANGYCKNHGYALK